jgi:hypothetical protein
VGRNQRRPWPGWVARQGDQRSSLLREPMISRTVNGFIALRPIPGSREAASCRPPWSWRWRRRWGRVPPLPNPPSRVLEPTPNHGHPAIHRGITPPPTEAEEGPEHRKASKGSSIRTLTARGDCRRGEVQANVFYCHTNKQLYLQEDCPRSDRGHLRTPICPATFGTQTFAPSRERPP